MNSPLSTGAIETFSRLRELPVSERGTALARERDLSPEDRAAVLSLLQHDTPTEEFLGVSIARTTSALLQPLLSPRALAQLHGYKILKPIGRGSFGTVFLAEQSSPHRLVAIKLLPPGATELQSRRFQFEAHALARLNHPNVANVLELAMCEGLPYLVMEYIDGVPLDAFVEARSPELSERIELLQGVCDGVSHVHQRGVLHRDLAPKNILVTCSGVPKIVDFGLAIDTAGRSEQAMRITQPGSVIGTLRYMSPEQLSGKGDLVDERSDTYSLGVIAFELLVGSHPYLSDFTSLPEAVRQLQAATQPRIPATGHRLTRDLGAVLRRAVEHDPRRRYQRAADFGEDLRRVVQNRPVSAIPSSRTYRASKFVVRNRALVLGTSLGALVLAVAIGGAVTSLRREAHTRNSALIALDVVVGRLLSPLGSRIGTLGEREQLLLDIEPEIVSMRERSPDDPRVLKIFADYQIARSDIHRDRGHHEASLAACVEAVRACERLSRLSGGEAGLSSRYSISLAKLGDSQHRLGRSDAGLESYRRALEVDEATARAAPSSLEALNTLFWSRTRFAEASGVLETFDQSFTDRAWAIADRMQEIDAGDWRSLETLIHARFGKYIRQAGGVRDATPLMEAEVAAQRLVATNPTSVVFNAKLLLVLTSVLKAPAPLVPMSERDRCLKRAFEVEALLAQNQGITRVEDRVLIEFREYLLQRAQAEGDDRGIVAQCEQVVEYMARYISGGWGTHVDLESALETLRGTYLPAVRRVEPDYAEERYRKSIERLTRLAVSRFPDSPVTATLLKLESNHKAPNDDDGM